MDDVRASSKVRALSEPKISFNDKIKEFKCNPCGPKDIRSKIAKSDGGSREEPLTDVRESRGYWFQPSEEFIIPIPEMPELTLSPSTSEDYEDMPGLCDGSDDSSDDEEPKRAVLYDDDLPVLLDNSDSSDDEEPMKKADPYDDLPGLSSNDYHSDDEERIEINDALFDSENRVSSQLEWEEVFRNMSTPEFESVMNDMGVVYCADSEKKSEVSVSDKRISREESD
jgi:hypothetical protein